MTLLPFAGDTYGDAGAWCWIDNSKTGKIWRFMAFYTWIWVAMILLVYFYYKIISAIKMRTHGADEEAKARIMSVVRRLIAYPIIMFVGYIFGTINRIQNAADENNPSVGLYILTTLFINLFGGANAIAYGMNASLQKDLRRCCSGKSGSDSDMENELQDTHQDERDDIEATNNMQEKADPAKI